MSGKGKAETEMRKYNIRENKNIINMKMPHCAQYNLQRDVQSQANRQIFSKNNMTLLLHPILVLGRTVARRFPIPPPEFHSFL